MTTMDVPASPSIVSPPSAHFGKLFGTDSFYFCPSVSPRLSGGKTNSSNGKTNANECKMVEVHGLKVASFSMDGQELICLPQVFDLFLKHLVGGLHTVYTKLKRLDICPVVCTVEQVRILRGIGAIQPGVNRCKLISRRDFEALYNDCTSASSRPGRPPKRSYRTNMQDGSRLLQYGGQTLLQPGLLSPTGLTAAAMAEALRMKRMKITMNLHNNKHDGGVECDSQEQSPKTGSDLSFRMMPHPVLPVTLPRTSVTLVMNQMNHLNTLTNMVNATTLQSSGIRPISVIKERFMDTPSLAACVDLHGGVTERSPRQRGNTPTTSPDRMSRCSPHGARETTITHTHPPTTSPDRMSRCSPHGALLDAHDEIRGEQESGPRRFPMDTVVDGGEGLSLHPSLAVTHGFPATFLYSDDSSVETVLTNVQGLLKVALENARAQEKQLEQERRELKMDLYREREKRETLEKQLTTELHQRASILKRLRKEKKAKRRLQEALRFECERRERVEQTLRHTSTHALLHDDAGGVGPNMDVEHS
ncbi:dachshund b isoform X2 [Brachyhypopomus gauderio]|uniref:dachshund b isoform X2 n=1 Tax=Brachyhypopomus gauderio TaxID=698409 RepID=UPI00404377F2